MTTLPAGRHPGATDEPGGDSPRVLRPSRLAQERADQVFHVIARGGGAVVLAIMCFVALFLATNASAAIAKRGLWDFVTTTGWSPDTNDFGMAALLAGTFLIALVALAVSLPLSLGLALFITQMATGRVRGVLQGAVDLMAAVPSLVFGLWGAMSLQSFVAPFAQWLSTWFGWIPVFEVRATADASALADPSLFKASTFMAGLVVALMIIPIQTSIMVESFSRAPVGEREGAFALGATRWGMIRTVVLPFGRGGIVGGTMLGLGRALGETIAVYLIINPVFEINWRILESGGNSVAANIALRYGESGTFAMSALMASGLALFVVTMIVNFGASVVIARSRSGAESEA